MNGPEATRIIRSLGYTGPIFGVTGNVLAEDIAMFKDHGADDVVAKPVQYKKIDELWARFENEHQHQQEQRVKKKSIALTEQS